MRKKLVWLIVLILLFGFSPKVYSFVDTYGAGIRANSMGGAFTAVADDYSAAYYNPAGLAQSNGHRLSIEYLYCKPSIDVNTTGGEELIVKDTSGNTLIYPVEGFSGSSNVSAPLIGIELDINKMIEPMYQLPINTQLGIYVTIPENGATVWHMTLNSPDLPHFISFGDEVNHLTLVMANAMEVWRDKLYLGLGATLALAAEADMIGPRLPIDGSDAVLHGYLGASTALSPVVGVLATPLNKKLKIGFTYKRETYIEIAPLQLTAEIDAGLGIIPLTLKTFSIISYQPTEYDFGLAVDLDNLSLLDRFHLSFMKKLLIAFDVRMQKWSEYDYDQVYAYWISPDNPNLVEETVTGPDFDDTIEYKLGAMYRYSSNIDIMAGFQRAVSPVPDQSGRVTNYLDMDRNIFSGGATYSFSDWPLTLSGGLTYSTFDGFAVDNTGVRGVAWGWEPGAEQESFEVAAGSVLTIGFGMSLSF